MKELTARKYEDGWLVEIRTTQTVKVKSDVLKIIRQEGLKKHPEIVEDCIQAD